jgi:prepilin-type N-terminal cleavage/methylation domain-containing protein
MQHTSQGGTKKHCSRLCPHRLSASGDATGEEGFTLIELVMVLIIMPLIVGAAAVVMITSLKATSDTNGTTARLAESHDAQITSTYFVRDIQNSTQITTAGTGKKGTSLLCGPNGPNTSDPKAVPLFGLITSGGDKLSYASTLQGGTPHNAVYPTFVRYECPSGAQSNTTTLSHNLKSTASATLDPLMCNPPSDKSCKDLASTGVSLRTVAIVEIEITEKSGFSFSLSASPRLGPEATNVTVSSSGSPSLEGDSVTFTATVADAANDRPLSGAVTFTITTKAGAGVNCINGNPTLDRNGQATCTTPPLTAAGSPYMVRANYPGTLGYQSDSGTFNQVVLYRTSTSVTGAPSPSAAGQPVTFTATVTGGGSPQGSVTFTISDANKNTEYQCSGGNVQALGRTGSAVCTIGAGKLLSTNSPFTIGASYPGSPGNAPSQDSVMQVVNPGLYLAALVGTGSVLNNDTWQATVTLTVQDANGNTVPGVVVTGAWTPAVSASSGCTTAANGQCSFTTGAISASTGETWTVANLVAPGYSYDPTNVPNSVAITHS